MLPTRSQSTVGLSYTSGIVVTYVPWVYGPNAPVFSYIQQAASYRQASASSDPSISEATLLGVPVETTTQDYLGQGNPGSVEFQLGSSNSTAVTVVVYGRYDLTSLETVSSSIISQWQNANPRASAALLAAMKP